MTSLSDGFGGFRGALLLVAGIVGFLPTSLLAGLTEDPVWALIALAAFGVMVFGPVWYWLVRPIYYWQLKGDER